MKNEIKNKWKLASTCEFNTYINTRYIGFQVFDHKPVKSDHGDHQSLTIFASS